MGTRSRGGYKEPENGVPREGNPPKVRLRLLVLRGKRHRRYRKRP